MELKVSFYTRILVGQARAHSTGARGASLGASVGDASAAESAGDDGGGRGDVEVEGQSENGRADCLSPAVAVFVDGRLGEFPVLLHSFRVSVLGLRGWGVGFRV